jgi:4-amino-4-deoxy-L-arabinose transferase-like glycosyltransferase
MTQAVATTAPNTSPGRSLMLRVEHKAVWWATAVLLMMFGLALSSMAQKAPTFDEQGFIVRGLAALRGYPQIRVGHPLGLNALNTVLLASDNSVSLPVDDTSWTGTSFHRPAELFLWETGNDVQHIIFLARLPSIWLGLLLAALVGRWAWRLSRRRWVGLVVLLFLALDPNILAHTRLATTDLGLTTFALLAGYSLWRFLCRPSWKRAILAGVAFGLLQNTKFTAMLFIPLFALVILVGLVQLWVGRRRGEAAGTSLLAAFPWRPSLMLLLAYPIAALLTLWAAYGFEIGSLPSDLPMLAGLSGKTLPLAQHLEQLLDIGGRLRVGTPSFLLGQYSNRGWWYYFPVAFLLKTPLPTLILLAWGSVAFIFCFFRRRRTGTCLSPLDAAALLLPALGFMAIALTTDVNLGYRHILTLLPFLLVFAVTSVVSGTSRRLPARRFYAAAILSLWLTAVALVMYPHYLAYFNVLAGGPDNGWRSLVDSNLDWGQDLDDLAGWMAQNDVDEVWLSYFGEARPEYYGISYRGLDSFPPRLMNPQTRPYAPSNPAPGVYAISATNLQGVHFTNHDQFAWFREQEPLDKLGYSIFLYQVPVTGQPVALLLSGVQMDEIGAGDYALLESNDVTPRWFDFSQSLILPSDGDVWLARKAGQTPHATLAPYLAGAVENVAKTADYELARFEAPVPSPGSLADFRLGSGHVQLQQAEIVDEAEAQLTVVTRWKQEGEPQPLKLFVHAAGADGQLLTQWDGLGADWQGWRTGDTLVQVHTLPWPDNALPEPSYMTTGLYNPQSGERWLTEEGLDHIQLRK